MIRQWRHELGDELAYWWSRARCAVLGHAWRTVFAGRRCGRPACRGRVYRTTL